MRNYSFIKYFAFFFLITVGFSACEKDEAGDDFGDGSPKAENVVLRNGYAYEYNGQGLVTKMSKYESETDEDGNSHSILVTKATITYPQSNRAVLVYYDPYFTFTYTFAFGENGFAYRIIQNDTEGSSLIKLNYDSEGHLIYMDNYGDILRMKYTDGNLTYVEDQEYDAKSYITYGSDTDFYYYGMSPFLLGVELGPFVSSMDWWFECGLDCALYAGFLGKPSKNLPVKIESTDSENYQPTIYEFEYYSVNSIGRWRQNEVSW